MGNHVFISYVRENSEVVNRLAADLRLHGIDVWLDRDRITPGVRWRDAIRKAIRSGAIFLACFSRESAARDKSYMNEELILAVEELRQRPTDRAWFVPIVIGEGFVPDRSIGGSETLRDFQWVRLEDNWHDAVHSITKIVREGTADGLERISEAPSSLHPGNSGVLIALTLGAGNVGRHAAHLYGSASSAAIRHWFDFADTPEVNFSIEAVSGLGIAHSLKPSTTYYFRYVAQDARSRTVRGEVLSFTTLP